MRNKNLENKKYNTVQINSKNEESAMALYQEC